MTQLWVGIVLLVWASPRLLLNDKDIEGRPERLQVLATAVLLERQQFQPVKWFTTLVQIEN